MGIIIFSVIAVVETGLFIASICRQNFMQKERIIAKAVMLLTLVILLAVGVLEGFVRYGLLMCVLALQVLIRGIRYHYGKRVAFGVGKVISAWIVGMVVTAMLLVPAFLLPQYREPEVTGNHEIDEYDFTWTDESRMETFEDSGDFRKVTVHIWSPKEEGSYPLILFDHGGTGIIASNTSTCRELASNGYVVVSVGHPYHSLFLKDTEGKVTIADGDYLNRVMGGADGSEYSEEAEREIYEDSVEWMAIRGADDDFVIDTILSNAEKTAEAPFDRIETEKIGAFGHSMGGAAAVHLGRIRDDMDAVIDLEGTMFGEYVGFENGYEIYNEEKYETPVLDVYSRQIYDEAMALTDVQYVNFHVAEIAKDYRYAVIEDAGHLNFTDLPLVCPSAAKAWGTGNVDARECIEEVNALVLNYFNEYLK